MVSTYRGQARTNIIPLLLVAVLSAVVVAGTYEVRARFARHRANRPLKTNAPEVSLPTAPALAPPVLADEGCADLRRRYLARCPNDFLEAPPPGQPVSSSQTANREKETRAAAALAPWLNPSPDELVDMAGRCEVRFEMPAITENQPPTVSDEDSATLSLSSRERALVDQTLNEMHAGLQDFAERAFAEATGRSVKASKLTLEEMLSDLQARPESGFEQARERLAQERAGLLPPPGGGSHQPPGERLLRLWASMGDAFEQRLAAALGSDRARQLRSSPNVAWMNRFSHSGCRSQPPSMSE
jgi:hypothetical protein